MVSCLIKVIGLTRSAGVGCPDRSRRLGRIRAGLVTPPLSNALTAQIAGRCGGALTRTSSRNGAVNDPASPTHDRGHASSEPRLAHPTRLHPADLAVRAAFWQVTRDPGSG